MAAAPQSLARLTQQDLESIIRHALDEARSRGATQAEAAVSQNTGLSVGVRLGQIETLEHQRDRSLGVTVYFGRKKASASTADFSPDAVRETVAKACSIARFTAEDACAGLADANLMQTETLDLDLFHPWEIDAEQAIALAKTSEAAALEFDSRINNSEGASLSTHQGLHVYGNTHGFVGGYPTTSHSLSCVVLAGSGDEMQRDYWYSSGRDWRELDSAESIGREAARRTVSRLDPRKITTRRAPGLWCLGQLLFRESLDLGHPERPAGPDPQAVEHEGDRAGRAERGDRVAATEVHRQRDRHGGDRDGVHDEEEPGPLAP